MPLRWNSLYNKLDMTGTPSGEIPVTKILDGSGTTVLANGDNEIQLTNGQNIAIVGNVPGHSLAVGVTGQIPVANGGTGAATLTDHGFVFGSGTNPVTVSAAPTDGQIPIGVTGGDPVPAHLVEGAGIAITNAPGSITVAAKGASTSGAYNIGIAYAAGTFTVQGADGTALSAANPGYVTLQSKSVPGRLVTIPVTANQTFTDGAAGTIANQRFDFVTGVNWSNDMPFYLYAVSHDNENAIAFGVSRGPCFSVSPAAASIGKTGAVVNVGQSDFFLLGNPTVAEYDANPCIPLGSFRMQFVGATDSWTVSALKTTDGVGQWHDSTIWTMPAGVNGATAGTFFQAVGGTQIIFATQLVRYRLTRTGLCSYYFLGENCTQAGVGENPARLTLPYQPYLTSQRISTAYYSPSGGANNVFWSYMTNNSYYVVFNALGAGSVAINQSAWDLGAATTLDTGFVYPVFGELP